MQSPLETPSTLSEPFSSPLLDSSAVSEPLLIPPTPGEAKRARGGNPNWPSADLVKAALSAENYSQPQISDVLWLFDVAKAEKLKSYADLCERIHWDKDETVLSRIMRGKYQEGSVQTFEKFFAKVGAFRALEAERKDYGEEPIVDTSVVKDIAEFCTLARNSQTIALLHGPNQSGKTKALQLYRDRNNHGRTIYVRMPVGGGARMFSTALAKACSFSQKNAYDQMREGIIRFFDPTMLLIVDEVHQCFLHQIRKVTVEMIREVHDLTGCGVVLCGTDVITEAMDDEKYRAFLGQTSNRGVLRLRVPPEPRWKDVVLICQGYGLPAPDGTALKLVRGISNKAGIGKLTKYLRMATKLARGKQAPLDWGHFLSTHATLEKWSKGGVAE